MRSVFAVDHPLCAVRTLGRLFEKLDDPESPRPLFSWLRGSSHAGVGVRYCDVMNVIKNAAQRCGYDTAMYATHSLRRGGASAMLLSGAMTLPEVKTFGRWKGETSCRLYVEEGARAVAKHAAWIAVRGGVAEHMQDRAPPRPREQRQVELNRVAQRLRQASSM